MKKKLVIVLVLAMLVGLLTGCVAMSDERLVINVVYAKSKDAATIDDAETSAVEDMTALRKAYPSLGEKGSGKTFYCGGENFADKLAEAAKGADIVVCVGEEFTEIGGVAAANSKVKWLWVGGDEALSSAAVYVLPAGSEDGALLSKLTEFVEHDFSKGYVWATAMPTAEDSMEESSAEQTEG